MYQGILDVGSYMDLLEEVYRKSIDQGIRAITFEDGMVLAAIAFYKSALEGNTLIVELGSGIGFSTIWMLLGASAGCRGECTLIAVERDQGRARELKSNAERVAGGIKRISFDVRVREAVDFLKGLKPNSVDMAFVDIEKGQYTTVLALLATRLKRGGVAVFHNAYYPPPPQSFFEELRGMGWPSITIPTAPGLLITSRP